MAHVVMCHGIGYQYKHRETSRTEWYEELRRSMTDAALPVPAPELVDAVFYGNCYGSAKGKGARSEDEFAGIPGYTADDVTLRLESELLEAFAEGLDVPTGGGKGLTQAALRRLEKSERLSRPAENVVIRLVRQVRRYLDAEDVVRECAQPPRPGRRWTPSPVRAPPTGIPGTPVWR
ncbi:hypothetical protein [Streptomyces sp. NPDC005017]|uniref:hypothetical protein n=1 Tax=Streptomyces sp. NPDC005017 TaxID=3364706 RepID=UPI0036C49794